MLADILVNVAIDASLGGSDPILTYRVPRHMRPFMRVGQLVWAPLRRQRVQGVVLDMYAWDAAQELDEAASTAQPFPSAYVGNPNDLRDLLDFADPEAVLTDAQLRLARWLSAYYRAPLYSALSLMLPTGAAQQSELTWRASVDGLQADLGTLPLGERGVLYYLRQHGETSERDLRSELRGSDADLRETYAALLERGLALRGTRITRQRTRPKIERFVQLAINQEQVEASLTTLSRSARQAGVFLYLARQSAAHHLYTSQSDAQEGDFEMSASDLYAATNSNLTTLRALEDKGLITIVEREVRRDPLAGDAVTPDIPPQLTMAQEKVWKTIAEVLDALPALDALPPEIAELLSTDEQPRSQAFLLHGVTGSGKTEIYLRAIGRALRRGRQALVLVPEIALTTQLVRRFAARFPGKLAVLHSNLSDGERYDEWRRLRRGEARIAIGSRSAVFAPLPELGIVIVDEEHEPTYKHDAAPRYHARDVAAALAHVSGCILLLGSATPSVESYAAALNSRMHLLELLERVGIGRDHAGLPRPQALPLPPVRLVDMRRELQQGNRSIFSRALHEGLEQILRRKEQAILFLNRRGAASFIMCRDCGHVISCPNCSSPLVMHYEGEVPSYADRRAASYDQDSNGLHVISGASVLICHSCGHSEFVPGNCPSCWSTRIKSFGVGTQRVEEEVMALFPDARTLRWDRDTVMRKGDHARMLDRFLAHEADVLVGTQMIAKGLDLPMVALVGVVAADTGLYLPDFRAGERAFQLMTQVAGRAGRRNAGAEVVIQTYTPEHYALLAAQEHDYHSFYAQEIAYREQTGYPPFGRLVRFVYAAGNDTAGRREAEDFAAELRALAISVKLYDWGLIGPAPAFFHRVRNRYRWHILLRADDPTALLMRLRVPPGWAIDVDPVHVL